MKKFLIWLSLWILSLWLSVFASPSSNYPDSFQVEINPSNFEVNQAVDVKVTAIKDGQVMKNYAWDFGISVEENGVLLLSHEATVPEWWWGTIKLENQGVVPYTQWLIIKKAWTFTVKVAEFTDETISWSATVTVKDAKIIDIGKIEIISPEQNSNVEDSPVSIMAMADSYPNAHIDIILNGLKVKEWTTDENGFLSDSIQLEQAWTNTLELRAINIDGATVAQSPLYSFLYSPLWDDLLKELIISPNEDLRIWDKVRVEITSDERVSSAKLILSWVKDNIKQQEFLMDKEGDGFFSKEFSLPLTWEFSADVQLTAATEPRLYTWVQFITVKPNVEIINFKILADTWTNGLVHLSWDTDWWESDNYAVLYWEKDVGSEEDSYQEFCTAKDYDVTLAPWKTYEFRIYATDEDHFQEWIPSEITEFVYNGITGNLPTQTALTWENKMCWEDGEHCIAPTAPTCIVSSIKFSTEKIGNKNYLVWSAVENATKYNVYKSDYADGSNKQFVGDTELTRFEYPFDEDAKKEVYAYYSIEAICSYWSTVMVTEVNKVQVGPFEDMMLIIIATALLYLMYRIYTYRV